MSKPLTIKSFVVGTAMIAALVVAPQEAAAGFHGGGFHGGGFRVVPAPRPAVHVGSFRPAGGFRVSVRSTFHPAAHVPASRVRMAGSPFGGPRLSGSHLVGSRLGGTHVGSHPIRGAGPVQIGPQRYADGKPGHTRVGRGEPRWDWHVRLPRGPIQPTFYQPDDVEQTVAVPDAAVQDVAVQDAVVPVIVDDVPARSTPVDQLVKAGGPATDPGTAACATPGCFVTVQFAPRATAADISRFLNAYNVAIADGPAKDGSYRIRLSDRPLPPQQASEVIRSMQSQTAVVSLVSLS